MRRRWSMQHRGAVTGPPPPRLSLVHSASWGKVETQREHAAGVREAIKHRLAYCLITALVFQFVESTNVRHRPDKASPLPEVASVYAER